ncbi:MAG: head GIN domain-containing protein [Bacteroidota bacterium]
MKKHWLPLLIGLLGVSLSLSAQSWKSKIKGEGPTTDHSLDLSKITGLSLGIPATVYLTQGKEQSVRIEAQQNIYDNIEQDLVSENWELTFDREVKTHEPITIHLTIAHLERLDIGGSGEIQCTNHFKNLSDIDLNIGGMGEITFMGDAEDISCNIGGSGAIQMTGASNAVDINIGGQGKIMAMEMQTERCNISSAGSSQVEIHVIDRLNVSMVGRGKVNYKGSPKVSSSIVGSGDVSKVK